MTELEDYRLYRGHHFVTELNPEPEWVTGVLVPQGETEYEGSNERSLRGSTLTHYVDPSTLTPVDFPGIEPVPVRAEVLREAEKLITGDRNAAYGSPTQNFQDTARIWTVQLGHKLKEGAVIDPGEVASLMIGLKLARIKASPKLDNWMDIAGYAGCGAEADTETGKISD